MKSQVTMPLEDFSRNHWSIIFLGTESITARCEKLCVIGLAGITMVATESVLLIRAGGTVMEVRDDNSLLKAIAGSRDHDALNELYARYQHRAFSIAFHILRNTALAEDAVQESMLTIWQSANYPANGDISQWILGVVAGKSLNLRRSQRRKSRREERVSMEGNRLDNALGEQIEKDELIVKLRSHIEQLPELESQLLVCCYGANMPHRKIAKLLGMPQQTVTYKIQRAVERLRSDLAKAGVAAVAPVISADNICEAVTSGHKCPPGMTDRLIRRIDNEGSKAAKAFSRRVVTIKSRSVGFLVLAAIIAGTIWLVVASRAPVVSDTSSTPAVAQRAKVELQEVNPFYIKWTFEQGIPDGFKLKKGQWNWQAPEQKRTGVIAFPPKNAHNDNALVSLPTITPPRPFVVIIGQHLISAQAGSNLAVLWATASNGGWSRIPHFDHEPVERRIYCFETFIVNIVEDEVTEIVEYGQPYPSRQIYLTANNVNIDSIEIRELRPNEIPEKLHDPHALIERLAMKRIAD